MKPGLALLAAALAVPLLASPAAAQSVSFVYANGFPKTHVQTGVIADEWIRKIQEKTEGRVKIRHVPGAALMKPEQVLEGLRSGVADVATIVTSWFPGQLPVSSTLAGTVDIRIGNKVDMLGVTAITEKLLSEIPEFAAEYEKQGLKPVLWVASPAYAIISSGTLASLDDFKNKKTRAFGPNLPKMLEAGGAVPIAMAYGEIYTSLQTGVIDAALTDPPAMFQGRFYEVAKNLITLGPGVGAQTMGSPVVYAFNIDSWNKMSEADRAAVLEVSREMAVIGSGKMVEASEAAFTDLAAKGVKISHLSAEETEKLAAAGPNFLELAQKALEAKELPGAKIVGRYKELAEAYAAGTWKP